jgi:hypothetical protein
MLRTLLCTISAIILLAAVNSCDKLNEKMNVTGNVAGRVLNSDGSPRGYVSVLLLNETGAEVQRQNAEDSGSFFFTKVPAGTYTFKVMAGSTMELPCETTSVNLGLGKTKQVDVKLKPEQPK